MPKQPCGVGADLLAKVISAKAFNVRLFSYNEFPQSVSNFQFTRRL